jgi:hypothetical protein
MLATPRAGKKAACPFFSESLAVQSIDVGGERPISQPARPGRARPALACRSAYAELVRDAGVRDQSPGSCLLAPSPPPCALRPKPSTNHTNRSNQSSKYNQCNQSNQLPQANLLVSRTVCAWPHASCRTRYAPPSCPLPSLFWLVPPSPLAPCLTEHPVSYERRAVRRDRVIYFATPRSRIINSIGAVRPLVPCGGGKSGRRSSGPGSKRWLRMRVASQMIRSFTGGARA